MLAKTVSFSPILNDVVRNASQRILYTNRRLRVHLTLIKYLENLYYLNIYIEWNELVVARTTTSFLHNTKMAERSSSLEGIVARTPILTRLLDPANLVIN